MYNPKLPNMQMVLLPTVAIYEALDYCSTYTNEWQEMENKRTEVEQREAKLGTSNST